MNQVGNTREEPGTSSLLGRFWMLKQHPEVWKPGSHFSWDHFLSSREDPSPG